MHGGRGRVFSVFLPQGLFNSVEGEGEEKRGGGEMLSQTKGDHPYSHESSSRAVLLKSEDGDEIPCLGGRRGERG